MRAKLVPGEIAIVPELDSAEGLVALMRILLAIDRVRAISLSIDGLRRDLRLGPGAGALYEHAMSEVAVHADAARLPWVVQVQPHRPGGGDGRGHGRTPSTNAHLRC